MSFGGPPKTAYGDQDFIKEDNFTQHGQSSSPYAPPPGAQNVSPYTHQASTPSQSSQMPMSLNPSSPYQSSFNPQQQQVGQSMPYNARNQYQMQNPGMPTGMDPINLTPEDKIFLQEMRRDVLFYRFIPIHVIGNSVLYYYLKQKSLDQFSKMRRTASFLSLNLGCFFFALSLTKDIVKNRILESPSTTPMMMALKQRNGFSVPMGGQDASMMQPDSELSAGWNTTSDGFSRRPYPPPPAPTTLHAGYTSSNQPRFEGGLGGFASGGYDVQQPVADYDANNPNSGGDTPARPITSYEELRARNRGTLPPRGM